MKTVRYQAHRGVSTEFPENTLSAYNAAVIQGYDIIEIDPAFTSDGVFVLLHDTTIDRTARAASDVTPPRGVKISDITYAEAAKYDYGAWFSEKFRGERLPTLDSVLSFAEKTGVTLKIDNKVFNFPENRLSEFLARLSSSSASIALTINDVRLIKKLCSDTNRFEIHYDGPVSEDILREIKSIAGQRPFTVWLPYNNKNTAFSALPKADGELCKIVKKYAELGIWLITKEHELDTAVNSFGASVIETNGTLKPLRNQGIKADTHTHTNRSHDSQCSIDSLALSAVRKGIDIVTVTNHCDIMDHPYPDALNSTINSVRDSISANSKYEGRVRLLRGAEIGEGFTNPSLTEKILTACDYDAIIGSSHAVRWRGLDKVYYAVIDFSVYSENELHEYLDAYFDDVLHMLKTLPCDIMAHLTCPLRYINGKYHRGITLERHMNKITGILEYIIKHGIAMEINTSGIGGFFGELMPDTEIIKLYHDMGGYLITIGSDSHTENNVGNGFDYLFRKLKELGIKNYFYFENRIPIQCRII